MFDTPRSRIKALIHRRSRDPANAGHASPTRLNKTHQDRPGPFARPVPIPKARREKLRTALFWRSMDL